MKKFHATVKRGKVISFDDLIASLMYQEQRASYPEAELEREERQMLFDQLKDHGNLLTSAAWYFTEPQALQFARMTMHAEGLETKLLRDIIDKKPFDEIVERDSISVIDLGCGNGQKARVILEALPFNLVRYTAVDASPYMGLFCSTNLMANVFPKGVNRVNTFYATIPERVLDNFKDLTRDNVAERIRLHKEVVAEAAKVYHELMDSRGMRRFLWRKRDDWQRLSYAEQCGQIHQQNAILDGIFAGEDHIDSQLQGKSMEEVRAYLEKLYFKPYPTSFGKLQPQFELVERLLTRVHEVTKDGLTYGEQTLVDYLSAMEEKAGTCPDPFTDPDVMRTFHCCNSTSQAHGLTAIAEMRKLQEELQKDEYSRVYGRMHKIEQGIVGMSRVKLSGWMNLKVHTMTDGTQVHAFHQRNTNLTRSQESQSRDMREFEFMQALGRKYSDFFTGDLDTLLRYQSGQDHLTFSKQVVMLLGQTIGNFGDEQRKDLVAKIYRSMPSGSFFMLGAELRPTDGDPRFQEKIDEMRKFYGAPELNSGLGPGEKFLRMALEKIGITGGVNYHVDYKNNRIEMGFTVTEDGVAAQCDGQRLTLPRGTVIPAASSYKFTQKELVDLVQGAGFDLVYSPDRYNYTVLLARKP